MSMSNFTEQQLVDTIERYSNSEHAARMAEAAQAELERRNGPTPYTERDYATATMWSVEYMSYGDGEDLEQITLEALK